MRKYVHEHAEGGKTEPERQRINRLRVGVEMGEAKEWVYHDRYEQHAAGRPQELRSLNVSVHGYGEVMEKFP
jgi:hypothetical protein